MDEVPSTITCVECGGTAHRTSYEPPDGWEPGQLVSFVCEDCDHRHDVVYADDD